MLRPPGTKTSSADLGPWIARTCRALRPGGPGGTGPGTARTCRAVDPGRPGCAGLTARGEDRRAVCWAASPTAGRSVKTSVRNSAGNLSHFGPATPFKRLRGHLPVAAPGTGRHTKRPFPGPDVGEAPRASPTARRLLALPPPEPFRATPGVPSRLRRSETPRRPRAARPRDHAQRFLGTAFPGTGAGSGSPFFFFFLRGSCESSDPGVIPGGGGRSDGAGW